MSKFILFMTFIILGVLLAGGLLFPDHPTMWLAATSREYTYIRILLMVSLIAMLVTNPPRNKVLRFIVGVLAIGLTTWSLSATYENQMAFMDTASILAASVSMGITALEPRYDYESANETATA
jgi:hypothetical protein